MTVLCRRSKTASKLRSLCFAIRSKYGNNDGNAAGSRCGTHFHSPCSTNPRAVHCDESYPPFDFTCDECNVNRSRQTIRTQECKCQGHSMLGDREATTDEHRST